MGQLPGNLTENAISNIATLVVCEHFTIVFFFSSLLRNRMLARLTAKTLQMPRVPVASWNSAKIIAMTWTACRIARRAVAPTCGAFA